MEGKDNSLFGEGVHFGVCDEMRRAEIGGLLGYGFGVEVGEDA